MQLTVPGENAETPSSKVGLRRNQLSIRARARRAGLATKNVVLHQLHFLPNACSLLYAGGRPNDGHMSSRAAMHFLAEFA
jgi:hypothetical protein